MRRPLALLSAAFLLLLGVNASALPVSPVVPAVPGAAQMSPNVRHVGTIPLEGVGVSLRFVWVGWQLRAFVSGAGGLSIYDATSPTAPTLLGHLPIYNWENEDIAVSKDGRIAYLTEFTGSFYLHAVDVSDPATPHVIGSLVPGGAHTVECADDPCHYLFGAEGQTYDVRDPAHIRQLPKSQSWGGQLGVRPGHNLHRDAAGYWTADTSPLVVFRLAPDPLHLKRVTTGSITLNTQYQHNNIRPRADRYVPRKPGASLALPLHSGELLLGEGETNEELQCNGANGAFSTWSMAGFDRGVPMRQLHTLRPLSNSFGGEDPVINGLGCSGHWFDQKDGQDGKILVSAAWYEHGTRFLDVDPRTGTIAQVGYFQPNRGSTSAAYWVPGTNVVWSVDYHSGIDILQFDQNPRKRPTVAATDASWLSRLDTDPFAAAMRKQCTAALENAGNPEHLRSMRG